MAQVRNPDPSLPLETLGSWRVVAEKIRVRLVEAAVVLGLAGLIATAFSAGTYETLYEVSAGHPRLHPLVVGIVIGVRLGTLLLALRSLAWLWYRPARSMDWDEAPPLTVIIPAYNEGAMVARTIDSVARAHYPPDRLQIFVIDDGSKDDTWRHIRRAARGYPGLVTTARFPRNRGKRAALAYGFERARGTIAVTVDSDSVIEAQTLLALAGPFRNPKVGAVAGRVMVYNRRQDLIPRMLHVHYAITFDFLRAAESVVGAVYCTPGALSAYRMAAVRRVLPLWRRQHFLGAACTFGEDRAMTNYILERGYDSVYQATAAVHTLAPVTYRKLSRMFLRWDRSYVREECRLAGIAWGLSPFKRAVVLIDRAISNLQYPLGWLSLALLFTALPTHPAILLWPALGVGLMGAFNALYYLRREASRDGLYSIVYSYYSFLALWWILPYAAITVRTRAWLTR